MSTNRFCKSNATRLCNSPVYKKSNIVERIRNNDMKPVSGLDNTDTSYFLSDVGKMIQNVNQLKEYLPNVSLYYGITANSDPLLLNVLDQCGVHFSASTGPEIELLDELGVDAESVYYSGLCKINRHIRTAASFKVNLMSIGTMKELKRVHSLHDQASLLLRVKTDSQLKNMSKNEKNNTMIDLSASGINIIHTFRAANDVGAKIVGLQIDLGPNDNFEKLVSELEEIIRDASYHCNAKISYLSIGSSSFNFHDMKQLKRCSAFLKTLRLVIPGLRIMAEPNHLFTLNAIELYCTVIGARQVSNEETDEVEMFYYLNDGLYGSLSNILYHSYIPEPTIHRKTAIEESSSESLLVKNVVFWGPTCDSMDKICSFDEYPSLKIGDVVSFRNVGSFCGSCATNFNGFEIAKNYCVISTEDINDLDIPAGLQISLDITERCSV